ncbi:MAG: OsmC family protein [Chloroflexi bacterium]|nr:OsmC family protein [Chloroflexota bacterium]
MARVNADYRERKRIVFEARGRHFTNVREPAADGGPVGYSSTELLLIAVGNCTLGALLNHELLREVDVARASAVLEAEMVPNPTRIERIDVTVELEVADAAVRAQREAVEVAACGCPLCNTLGDKVQVRVRLAGPQRSPSA